MQPSDVALQMGKQVFPTILELLPNQTEPQKPRPERVLLVLRMRRFPLCGFLGQRLIADRKAKNKITADHTGMKGGIEGSELNRSLAEHTVEVQQVIPAVVVVIV